MSAPQLRRVPTDRIRCCLALLAGLVVGCEAEEPAPPPAPALVPVHGTITVDGKPLDKAVVAFLPTFSGQGTHSVGETNRDGRYELSTLGQPGAGVGEYRVVVSFIVGPDGKVADLASRSGEYVPPELDNGKELVPSRYSDFSKTELRATIRRAGPPLDFALEGPLHPAPGTALGDAGTRDSRSDSIPAAGSR